MITHQSLFSFFSSSKFKNALIYSLTAYFLLRIVTSLILLIGIFQPPTIKSFSEYSQTILEDLQAQSTFTKYFIAPWYRWDTTHYLEIADHGYTFDLINTVWPPLYPVLIKLVSFVIKPSLLASLFISNIFAVITFFLLYIYTAELFSEEIAKKSIYFLSIFPTSFYLIAGYSESIFLAFSIAVFLSIKHKRWLLAGILSLFATMVRLQGIFLTIPILIELFIIFVKNKNFKSFITHAFSMIFAPFFYIIFSVYVHFGLETDWPWNTLSQHWSQHLGFPWEGIIGNITILFGRKAAIDSTLPIIKIITLILTFIVIYFLIKINKKIPLSLFIYSWISLFLLLGKVDNESIMISTIRYLLVLFPVFISMAVFIKNERKILNLIVFIFSVLLEIILLVLFYWQIWVA